MNLLADRVQLDPLEPKDIDFFTELHLSEVVTRYLSPARPLTEAESFRLFCQVLGHAQVRGFGYWAVRRRTDQAWLGVVGLWFPEGWPGVELGWRFGPEHWGQGYATEAARTALNYARESLDLREVISIIHTDNERSARLARRLGMSVWKTRSVGDVGVSIFRWHESETDDGSG
jgi:ribosomal-protein-alanine N-acetyltransferase